MNETLNQDENISSLSVEDLLGLLNSPVLDVVDGVKSLIKTQFSVVTDRWLINGLLEYFFSTNSKRIVNLLISAPEPHSKFLLDKICTGIKGNNKFQHLSLLLYAVSQNPVPIWIHKPHFVTVIQAVVQYINPKQDSDISVLVTGVMIIVISLPYIPVITFRLIMGKIFALFWCLVHWVPNSDQDLALKPHLQMAVYYLFHRLYALYPCHLLSFMKSKAFGHSKLPYFVKTLRPLLERVRLHPQLVSESKESEIIKNRWVGLEATDLIYECSKLSLDPLYETPDDETGPTIIGHEGSVSPKNVDASIPSFVEGSFWSPAGVGQSPSPVTKSAPHTPIFGTYQGRSNLSVAIAESPPETAIEATPETTPYPSPMPMLSPSPLNFDAKGSSKSNCMKMNLNHSLDSSQGIKNVVSLQQKQTFSFAPKSKLSQESGSILSSKLQQIKLERSGSLQEKIADKEPVSDKQDFEPKVEVPVPVLRKRRTGVFKPAHESEDLENKSEDIEFQSNSDFKSDEEFDNEDGEEEIAGEGLGIPGETSMTDLMKSVNTKRLRFLSTCGPPPNMNFSPSPTKGDLSITSPLSKQRSRSCPIFTHENQPSVSSVVTVRDLSLSSMSVSTNRILVDKSEMATQTEEIPIVNPYEHLLEVLTQTQNIEMKREAHPHALDLFLSFGKSDVPIEQHDLCWNTHKVIGNDVTKTQLRATFSLSLLEKTKCQTYADRNRRLLRKIKKLHSLQEKDIGTVKEKDELRQELMIVKEHLSRTKALLISEQKSIDKMVDKSRLDKMEDREEIISKHREHLRERCAVLCVENQGLSDDLQSCKGKLHDYERQIQCYKKHRKENQTLKKKLVQLDKKLVIMGEIQAEMRLQLKSDKQAQRKARFTVLTKEIERLQNQVHELDVINIRETTSLDATNLHFQQLKCELNIQKREMEKQNDCRNINEMRWQEKLNVLQKRNNELQAISLTKDTQMLELLRYRPEKEGQDGAASSRLVAPKPVQGFPPPENLVPVAEIHRDSFLFLNTSKNFESPSGFDPRNS